MLRRLFLAQAVLVTAVVAALTGTHFALNAVHPDAADAIFLVGLGVAGAILLASVAVIGRGIARMVRDLEAGHLGTVAGLAAAIDASDDYTGEHSGAVRDLVAVVGRTLGLSAADLRELELVATLHDVGKIGIPKEILHKPGPLDADEWEVMRRHPEIGARILARVPRAGRIRDAVHAEHEHWDGSGYPRGLRGPQIPLFARIVLACDAYHAMTSDRPYRRALPETEARRRLRADAGRQFDPTVVEALLAGLPDLEAPQPPLAELVSA
ncbi:MAG: HD-GYP domain-containing protein [Thermoleophilia bacterium]